MDATFLILSAESTLAPPNLNTFICRIWAAKIVEINLVNIYPQEIENLLIGHPKVADAAVVGAPDEEMGEKVVAVIQPMDWSQAGDDLRAELTAFCRASLSGVKLPRQIDFMEELPRHPTGKLYKRLIRDAYWARAAPAP